MTVSIGKLSDTPDTGDPILSPFFQEIATYARHIFASKAELDAQWSDAPNGAHAFTTTEQTEYNRIGGVWVAHVPQASSTWTSPIASGITVGSGTTVARYYRIGKLVFCSFKFTLGAGSAVTGNPNLNLPFTAESTTGAVTFGDMYDASTTFPSIGYVNMPNTTALQMLGINVAGSYATVAGVTASLPFVWAVGDTISINAIYLAA